MKKRRFFVGRLLAVILSAELFFTGVSVRAEELTSGEAAEEEIQEDTLTAEPEESDWDAAEPEEELSSEETESEDGIRYIKGRPLTAEEEKEQRAPLDNLTPLGEIPELNGDFCIEIPSVYASNLPSHYDARENGLVTSVKNQGKYNACWAFVMASVLETSLLSQGLGSYDLSEEHLCYFFANRVNDPLGNTANDKNIHLGMNSSGQRDYHEGGNDYIAAYFLSTWSGMATEEEFPMNFSIQAIDPNAAYYTTAYMKDAVFAKYSVNGVKQLLMEYNSVGASICQSNRYYNADTAAYCDPDSSDGVTHAVTIVGWDDTYSKNNFNAASGVTSDGAWIVKNSWGEGWGDNGYCYISYEEKTFNYLFCATAQTNPEYNNNYFYDGSSALAHITLNPKESVACVYKAKAGNGKAEVLGEIVTSTYSANSQLAIQVFTNLKDPSDPGSGTAAYSSPVRYTQKYAGVDSIAVPEVLILPGSSYAVVVTNVGSSAVTYEAEYSTSYSWCSFEAGMEPNQGFRRFSYNGDYRWKDLYSLGMCPRLKARTRTESYTPQINLSDYSVTMVQGKTRILFPSAYPASFGKGGYTYVSSDSSVAEVNDSGMITAVSSGTAVIICESVKVPGLKAECQVTVKPCAPAAVRTQAQSYNKILISWSEVPGCDGYTIYRREAGGELKGRASVNGAQTISYLDKDVVSSNSYIKPGVKYTYSVRAYKIIGGKKVYSDHSASSVVSTTLETTATTVRTNNNIYNTISWKQIPGANGYYVYRRVEGGSWELIKKTGSSTLECQDRSVKSLVIYQYMVRAYRNVYGKQWFSPYKCSGKVITSPALQSISSIVSTSDGLKLSWKPQTGCTGYRIYRKEGNGAYKLLKDVMGGTSSSYLDKNTKKGITYTYYVQAFSNEFYGKVFSKYTRYTVTRK